MHNLHPTLGDTFIWAYVGVFGVFDTSNFGSVEYVIFVLMVYVETVIFLNVTIGALMHSQARVLDGLSATDPQEKNAIVIEIIQVRLIFHVFMKFLRKCCQKCCLRSSVKRKQPKSDLQYLFYFKNIQNDEDDDENDDFVFSWQGKFRALRKQINALQVALEHDISVKYVSMALRV